MRARRRQPGETTKLPPTWLRRSIFSRVLEKRAIDIRYQQLLKLGRLSEAADVILAAIGANPNVMQWRHQAWELLSRMGRRQEASQQADLLCRAGEATESELVSLLRRNDSFPTSLTGDENPEQHFEPGMGMANWYFTQRMYRQALEELSAEHQADFSTPAARALYGRLLAETQSFERVPAWYARCGEDVTEFSDYWAALGVYFFDQHQFDASARSLMEAVVRDPTDDLSVHRLARVFDALGRPDDAEEFRQRGILIAQMDRDAEMLSDRSAAESAIGKELPGKLLKLGRPFESLGWTLAMLPAAATAARTAVTSKRVELSQDVKAIEMAGEMSLMGVDANLFSVEPALETLRRSTPASVPSRPVDSQPLAVPRLVNVAAEVGLSFQWYQDEAINLASIPIHEMMGGAIAVIDFDLDGWPDVYLGQGSGDPPTGACTRSNQLFRNVGSRFRSVTEHAGVEDFNYSTGIAAGDVNQDGFPDLYLGSLGRNRLLINCGDGSFRDATDRLGEISDQFTSSLAIADINGDALPDLFEAVYLEMEGGFELPDVGPDGRELQPSPLSFYAQSDRWFENTRDGHFRAHEIASDVAEPGTSLGVIVTDFDADGTNEVFVGNDGRPNHYLVQAGDNQFHNVADALGLASGFGGYANACMGIATGDFDRDGTLDVHIANFLKESDNHYLQIKGGGFTDFAPRYGFDAFSVPYVGFGNKAIDVDRNGWLDLIVTNGHVFDRRHLGEQFQMSPQMLVNQGDRFQQITVDDPSGYWDGAYLGRAIAMSDFDRDGAIDFFIGHLDQPLAYCDDETRLQEPQTHWIQLELVGTSSERDAIGARIELTMGDKQLIQSVTAGDGYFCSDEAVIDLGLGSNHQIDRLQIFWPSGNRQTFDGLAADRRYLVVEGQETLHTRQHGGGRDRAERSREL